ncbi:Hypothetical predicted protein, partial [Pelobates cultripes]
MSDLASKLDTLYQDLTTLNAHISYTDCMQQHITTVGWHPSTSPPDFRAQQAATRIPYLVGKDGGQVHADALLQPITLQEVLPGADGLPNVYYKKFKDIPAPHLLKVYQRASEEGSLPTEMLLATIVTLPKTDKPTDSCKNFRPIYRLNTVAKFLAMYSSPTAQ